MQMPLQYGQHKQNTTYVVSVVGLEPTASSVRERASAADLHTDIYFELVVGLEPTFLLYGRSVTAFVLHQQILARLYGFEPQPPVDEVIHPLYDNHTSRRERSNLID